MALGRGEVINVLMRNFLEKEKGLGTVEIVIIIAVLVGIALIFREAIINFVTDIMENVFGDDSIVNDLNSTGIRDNNKIN